MAEYDHSDRSIRHVQVCDTALKHAAPTYPDHLTEDHLRGASVALTGHASGATIGPSTSVHGRLSTPHARGTCA